MSATIATTIFRSNDIRGVVGTELTGETYFSLGKAFGTIVRRAQERAIYVGHDSRPSSAEFAQAFVAGAASAGCEVHALGMVPVPVLYFAATRAGKAYGAMITASHLPAKYNGVKLCRGSQPLERGGLAAVRDLILAGDVLTEDGSTHDDAALADEYVEYIAGSIRPQPGLKVVVDCQNGAASLVAPRLLGRVAQLVGTVHCDPGAPYPFERPDPQVEANLVRLKEQVLAAGADLGIAYDGDADRFAAVDETGAYVLPDYIMALFARDILSTPGQQQAKVVFDVLSSMTLFDEVKGRGGAPIWCKSGHSYIKEAMTREGAQLGGESSGHMCFADRYLGYDDGIYASCRLIELVGGQDASLGAQVATLSRYMTSAEERPHCPDDKKFPIIERIKEELGQSGASYTSLDGIELYFPQGRGVVRASNTEPALSIRFEASSQEALQQYHDETWVTIDRVARSFGVELAH